MNGKAAMAGYLDVEPTRARFARATCLALVAGAVVALAAWCLNAEVSQPGWLRERLQALGPIDRVKVVSMAGVSLPIVSVREFDLLEDGCKSKSSDQVRINELVNLVTKANFELRGEARFVNKTFAVEFHAQSGHTVALLGATTVRGTALELRDDSKGATFGLVRAKGLEHELYGWISKLAFEDSCGGIAELWYRDGSQLVQ